MSEENNPHESNAEFEDHRTPYQIAVDLTWRTEGLGDFLRDLGSDDLATQVEIAQMTAFSLKPDDTVAAEGISMFLSSAVAECGEYDSGVRKYEKLPDK